MKKRISTFVWVCILGIVCIFSCMVIYRVEYPTIMLRNVVKERLVSQAEENSLLSHFTFRDPKSAGLSGAIRMPVYSKEAYDLSIEEDKVDFEVLRGLDFSHGTNSLSKSTLCNALMFSLKHEIALSRFSYFEEPFAPYSGVQNELAILLTEYSFDEKKDVVDYLEILSLLPDYLEGLCQYEREKAEARLFMSDSSADVVIQTLDNFCALPDSENIYLKTFESRLKNLYENRKLTKKEYAYYLSENERLIKTIVFPALQKTGDALTLLKAGDKSTPKGLCNYPGGKEYYEIYVCSVLGEDLPVPALKNAFCRQLQADYIELNTLLQNHTDYFIAIMGREKEYDPLLSLSAEDCIPILQKQMGADFGSVSDKEYPYEIKSVDAVMESYTNPAYYFTPPVDDLKHNIIYINHAQTKEGLSLFTTLAHEGFPGHLYQAVTSGRSLSAIHLPSLSGVTYYGGFLEGYATYVEFLSYDYAKKAAAQLSLNDQSSLYYDYLMYQRRICLNLYSILDIMIHYEGATCNDIAPFLKRIGITDAEALQSIYDYIATEPATYIKYYGGYLKILECKNLAKDVWGEHYNESAFHDTLLKYGPVDFFSLKNAIKAEIP